MYNLVIVNTFMLSCNHHHLFPGLRLWLWVLWEAFGKFWVEVGYSLTFRIKGLLATKSKSDYMRVRAEAGRAVRRVLWWSQWGDGDLSGMVGLGRLRHIEMLDIFCWSSQHNLLMGWLWHVNDYGIWNRGVKDDTKLFGLNNWWISGDAGLRKQSTTC